MQTPFVPYVSALRPALRILLSFACAALSACGPNAKEGHGAQDAPDLAIHHCGPNDDCDGDGYSIAKGDCNDNDPTIHPGAAEICGDHKDQDCDGVADELCDDDADGYAVSAGGKLPGGDCNDGDPAINPGALEVPKNLVDDNCDGMIDEDVKSCDTMINMDPKADALAFANAMDLCKPWLKDASFNKLADPHGKKILPRFGFKYMPQAGATFVLLSTGNAAIDERDPYGANYISLQPGTGFQGRENNPLPIESHNVCTGGLLGSPTIANDMAALTMTILVPTNAKAFTFKFNFFSAEYPEYVGNQYNDMFVAHLQSKKFTGNVSFDSNNDPVTVNSGFFEVCDSSPICPNPPFSNPKTQGHTCHKGPGDLDGTGYELYDKGERVGGATGWLSTSARVTPGETITLTLFVFDNGDHFWDSAVLLDSFQWLFDDTLIGTMPVQ